MNVLFVHERFGALAGAETNVYNVAAALKERGHGVAILHGPTTNKGEAAWQDVFSQRFPLYYKNCRHAVEKAVAQFQPHVIYVHKMADLEVIDTLLEQARPLIRMVHDHDIYCMRSYKYNYFNRKICTRPAGLHCVFPCGAFIARSHNGRSPIKFVSYLQKKKEIELNRRFDRMVVVTRYMRDELLRNGFDPQRIEIHPPVPKMGDPNVRSNFSNRNLILFAGQIIRGKGVDVLLKSLVLVEEPFECVILGDGSHRAHCEKLSRSLGLANRVHFAGFVPQEKMKRYFSEATVFVISSLWPEPFATVGMEVMRYGLPVIAFDAGGIKDWLMDGYNGYLVPWNDTETYARRLDQLLRNKNLARTLGEQGRRLVDEQYHFEKYIGALEYMFARVSAERQPWAAAV